jgi:hypothetical protein
MIVNGWITAAWRHRMALLTASTALTLLPVHGLAATDPALEAQLKALAQQLQIVQQQNDQKIQALTKQVQDLQAQLAATKTAPAPVPTGVTMPQQGTVLTKNPGNLEGMVQVPPGTIPGVATPDTFPKTTAAAVSSGGDRVKLSISGQINRMEAYGNDGKSSAVRNVDNNTTNSRLRFQGEGRINPETSGGLNLEVQITPNSATNTSLTQDSPSSVTNFTPTGGTTASNTGGTFTARQVETYLVNRTWGGVRLGFGSTATYQISEFDESNTLVASYGNVADIDGGFAFRQRGEALIPSTVKGKFVDSPANAYGPAVGTVFNFMNGLSRDDRIRYDSPQFGPFQISTSLVDGGAWDIALRMGLFWEGAKISAGFGFADAEGRNHSAPSNAYGYASAPVGNGPLSTPSIADTSANESRQYSGSASVLLPNGLNVTVGGGVRDVKYADPLGLPLSPVWYYGKLGYLTNFWDFGKSAFAVNYVENDELNFAGDTARDYGIEFVQDIDDAGMQLYVTGHRQFLSRSFASYYGITLVTAGARVRF